MRNTTVMLCLFMSWATSLAIHSVFAGDFNVKKLRNWHQWRGPHASGEAPLADPPTSWNLETNIKWKVQLPGHGTSTPVVWDDRIFILTAIETDRVADPATAGSTGASAFRAVAQRLDDARPRRTSTGETIEIPFPPPAQRESRTEEDDQERSRGRDERFRGGNRGRRGDRGFGRGFGGGAPTTFYQFVVLCFAKDTGALLWQRVACEVVPHEGKHPTGSYAAASPITNGRHVFCSFGSRGIYCFDMEGNPIWTTDLGEMQTRNGFGEGSSPALHDETLIINWDHEGDSFIVALDATTALEKWRQERDEPTTWNTPLVVEHNGRFQVIANGSNRVRSYDLETGELVWECGGQTTNPIPSPLSMDGLAICVSGFRGYAGYGIPLNSTGDLTDTDRIAWKINRGTPYVSSAALCGDRLYFTKDRSGIMSCVDARTGRWIIDQRRLPGMNDMYASPVSAAGRVYFNSRDGITVVIDGTADDLQVLAENELHETMDASPAIVDHELFIRGAKHLFCIAEK